MKAGDSLNARYMCLTISCFEISFFTMFVLDTIPETIFSYGRKIAVIITAWLYFV